MENGNVADEVTYCFVYYLKIWQIARKSNSLYILLITILSVKFG